jgi:N-methylhydantoinase B
MEFLSQAMTDLHDDLREGDAYLHNDPYLGNTHPADHVILVPVFFEGKHVFTAAAKAHQADCGNSRPTTYAPYARDVYEEGSLIFPCVLVQRDYRDVDDIIRMCRRRIRVPEQWYGDYLAGVGAARIAENRLRELCARYGLETIERFVEEWFDYSERRIAHVISQMPAGTIVGARGPRSVRAGTGWDSDHGEDHRRSGRGPGRARPDGQHRLPARPASTSRAPVR